MIGWFYKFFRAKFNVCSSTGFALVHMVRTLRSRRLEVVRERAERARARDYGEAVNYANILEKWEDFLKR